MITIILPSHTLQVSFEHLIAVRERLEDKTLMQLRYLCMPTFRFFALFCCYVCGDVVEAKKWFQELRIKIESVQRISVTVIRKLRNRYTNTADRAVTCSSLPVITKVKILVLSAAGVGVVRAFAWRVNGRMLHCRFHAVYCVCCISDVDRLCGLVVGVSGYRYRGPGFDPRRYQIF